MVGCGCVGDYGFVDVFVVEDCVEEVGGEEFVDFKFVSVKEEFGLGDVG